MSERCTCPDAACDLHGHPHAAAEPVSDRKRLAWLLRDVAERLPLTDVGRERYGELLGFATELETAPAPAAAPGDPAVIVQQCAACNGEGRVPLGDHFVTREQAMEAGDLSLEGVLLDVEYGWCSACGGGGVVEVAVPALSASPPPARSLTTRIAVIHDSGDASVLNGWTVTLEGHTLWTVATEADADVLAALFRGAIQAAEAVVRSAPPPAEGAPLDFYDVVNAAARAPLAEWWPVDGEPVTPASVLAGLSIFAVSVGERAGDAPTGAPQP